MRKDALFTLLLLVIVLLASIGSARTGGKGDVQSGATVYKQQCLRCHGELGKGDGPAAKILNPKPHDLSKK